MLRHIPLKNAKDRPKGRPFAFVPRGTFFWTRFEQYTHFREEDTILAVPKIFFGIHLENFDRGAKPFSLYRPLDALRRLCST